jgi:hypothetical protein
MYAVTLKAIGQSLERWQSREALTWARTKLLCSTHQTIESVVDFLPLTRLAKLNCGCKRPVVLMTDQERNEFDAAQQATKKKRLIKTSPTLQVFEEDIEAEAA